MPESARRPRSGGMGKRGTSHVRLQHQHAWRHLARPLVLSTSTDGSPREFE